MINIIVSSYNTASQLTSLTFGNNVVTTNYTYHSQNLRLTNLQTLAGVTYLQRLNYTYDNVGNVSQIQDNVRNETQNFAYDDLDRLTSVTSAYSQGWTYNAIGNILTRTGVDAATFTYGDTNHKHAVTQVGTTAYTYDPNGNMTARGSDAFTYDYENRLTNASVGGVTTAYTYNADSARVKKVVGSTTTYYVGNWYEVTNSSAITKYYYFGAQRVAMRTSAGVTYLHGDHLGSTSATSGAQPSSQTYYAFGKVRSGSLPTDYTFTGQKNDASSALMFYNARYYDANIGRFVQADPIVSAPFNPQSLNRFAYVLNNPVRYIDPSGYYCKKPGPPPGDDGDGDEGMGILGICGGRGEPSEEPEPPPPGGENTSPPLGEDTSPPLPLNPTQPPREPTELLQFISWEVNAIIDPPTWDRDPDPGAGCLVGCMGGLQIAGIRFRNWLAQNLRIGRTINYANTPYPKYIDPRTRTEVPFPKGNLQWIDKPLRVCWTGTERRMFIREWEQEGFSVPPGGWSKYDIHHIHPKEYGGTNDFWNLVPVERGFHQQHFNPWWDSWYY
jgi:RHS repeat-associated protein